MHIEVELENLNLQTQEVRKLSPFLEQCYSQTLADMPEHSMHFLAKLQECVMEQLLIIQTRIHMSLTVSPETQLLVKPNVIPLACDPEYVPPSGHIKLRFLYQAAEFSFQTCVSSLLAVSAGRIGTCPESQCQQP